jgi:hypothetical protein
MVPTPYKAPSHLVPRGQEGAGELCPDGAAHPCGEP